MTEEPSVLERAARALCRFDGLDPDAPNQPMAGGVILDIAVRQPAWKQYVHKARAVLQAIRTPSEPMIEAAHDIDEDEIVSPIHDKLALLRRGGETLVYQAMIDTALAE